MSSVCSFHFQWLFESKDHTAGGRGIFSIHSLVASLVPSWEKLVSCPGSFLLTRKSRGYREKKLPELFSHKMPCVRATRVSEWACRITTVGSHVSEHIDRGGCADNWNVWMNETILCIQSRHLCVGYDSRNSDKWPPTVVWVQLARCPLHSCP